MRLFKTFPSRRCFLKGVAALPAVRWLGGSPLSAAADELSAQESTERAGPRRPQSEPQSTGAVFQRFEQSHVPDKPFEWLIPRRYMLYMRHSWDYVGEFVNDFLKEPLTGNLFNRDSRTFLGIADSPHIGMIWDDGTISFEGVPGFASTLFGEDPPCTIKLLPNYSAVLKHSRVKGYLPFVTMERTYQGWAFSQLITAGAAAYHGRMLYTVRLGASMESYAPANPGSNGPVSPRFRWNIDLTGAPFHLRPNGALHGPAGVFGKCLGKFEQRGEVLSSEREFAQPDQWIVLVAGNPLSDSEVEALDAQVVQGLIARQEQAWDDFLTQGLQLKLPIQLMTDAYRASLIGIKIAQRKIVKSGKTYYVTLPGLTVYKKYWWRDCSLMHRALDTAGFHEDARRGLALSMSTALPEEVNQFSAHVNITFPPDEVVKELGEICRYELSQRPDGSWTAPPGQWDGTGLALYGLASHYLMTRDDAWLGQALPYMERGAEFLLRARVGMPGFQEWVKEYWPAYAAVEPYAKAWEPGLLPGGGGEGGSDSTFRLPLRPKASESELKELAKQVPLQSYNHDCFAVLGLRAYAEVLEQTKKGDATPYRKAIGEYAEALERSVGKTMKRFGIYWIPAGPDGGVKMSLIGAVLYPCRVFPADHPMITGTFDYFRAQAKPNLAPEGFYGTHPDRWSFTQWFLIMGELVRGEHEEAWRAFDTYLRCMWLPGSWRENFRVPHSRYAWGEQPDLLNASLYVEMLRSFMVREEGEEVWIADGLHPLWLGAGQSLSVEGAPTDFGGKVSYEMRRSEDGKRIELEIENRGGEPKRFVWRPKGFGEVSSATVNGNLTEPDGGRVVFEGSRNHVVIRFRQSDNA